MELTFKQTKIKVWWGLGGAVYGNQRSSCPAWCSSCLLLHSKLPPASSSEQHCFIPHSSACQSLGKFSWILLTGTQRRAFIWKLWGSVHNETHPTSSRIQFLGGMAPPPLSLCCQPHSTPVPRLSPFLAQDPLRPQSKQLQVKRFPCLGLFAFLLSYPPENFFF